MPFLRFSRDKRGYEHVYLVHAVNRRGKPSRPRVLYWYRTPPGIKVGRLPFDDEIRRMLEAQYPGIRFDWKAIVSTPMPPAEPEYWRERRRVERAAKQARHIEDVETDLEPVDSSLQIDDVAEIVELPSVMASEPDISPAAGGFAAPNQSAPPLLPADSSLRRRRRRGGRSRHGRFTDPVQGTPSPASPHSIGSHDSQEPGALEDAAGSERVEPVEPIPIEPVEPTGPVKGPEE